MKLSGPVMIQLKCPLVARGRSTSQQRSRVDVTKSNVEIERAAIEAPASGSVKFEACLLD